MEAFSSRLYVFALNFFPSQLFEERASALDCGGKAERRHRFPHETETSSIPERHGAAHPGNRSLRTPRLYGRAPMRLPDTNLTN